LNPTPVSEISLKGGEIILSCFGKNQGIDWHPDRVSLDKIADVARRYGTRTVFSPRVRPAVYGPQETFRKKEMIKGVSLFFSEEGADATMLPQRAARTVAAADCPIIVGWNAWDDFFVTHAGRSSLIDPARVTGEPGRKYESVVDILVEMLGYPEQIKACVAFGIRTKFVHSPYDEKYGDKNKTLLSYLDKRRWTSCVGTDFNLDLYELIRLQFASFGVHNVEFDDFDTSQRSDVWSQRREEEKRNLIFVVRP
jgi:hypothetical protein